MKSLLFVLFSLLFVSSAFSAAADWEGVWEWTGVGYPSAYLCYEDGWLFGTAGRVFTFAAKVNDAGDEANGNWWGVGYKHGGYRTGQSSNSPSTGWFKAELSDDGVLSAHITFRGKSKWWAVGLGDKVNDTVEDRIPYCGIVDPKSEWTVAGDWVEQSTSNFTIHAWYCNEGKDYHGSYEVVDNESGEIDGPGYVKGKCSWGGRICRSDWSEYPLFGVQLDRVLSDGTLQTIWWNGPTSFINYTVGGEDNTPGNWYVNDRSGDAEAADCDVHSDVITWPFKCKTFEETEDCEANPYYCKVRESNGKCRKIRHKSPFHF
jgi:hypothetical protein